jgi:hypothetical protein
VVTSVRGLRAERDEATFEEAAMKPISLVAALTISTTNASVLTAARIQHSQCNCALKPAPGFLVEVRVVATGQGPVGAVLLVVPSGRERV